MTIVSIITAALLQVAAPQATTAPADSAAPRTVSEPAAIRRAANARLVPPVPPPVHRVPDDTIRRRAVEYSDWYYRRLLLHRWLSYAELPVFAAEYALGQRLISSNSQPEWVKPAHQSVAGVLGGLFAVNTVTGAWNLWESRGSTDQRGLVWTHSALMLAADAGFAATGILASNAGRSVSDRNRHKQAAIVSMGVASLGTVLMWFARR